jgi:hypothetical protein
MVVRTIGETARGEKRNGIKVQTYCVITNIPTSGLAVKRWNASEICSTGVSEAEHVK